MENDLGQGQGHNRRSQRSNFGPKFRLDLLSTHGIMAKLWSMTLKVTVHRRECLSEHFDAKVLHID